MLSCFFLLSAANMLTLEKGLIKYLSEVTGLDVNLTTMSADGLPLYLESRYSFSKLSIGRINLTAIFVLQPTGFTPAKFRKQVSKLPQTTEFTCVVAASLPAYVRKRLIEMGQAFVVPGVQMFLPMLGMELRSRARVEALPATDMLSPASQAVFFYCLQYKEIKVHTPLSLSKALGYSAMSMSRAVSELAATNLADVSREGKERLMRLRGDPVELWQMAQPLLRSPVARAHRIQADELDQAALLAGESALSVQTLLGEPIETQYAISKAGWQLLNKAGIEKIPVQEPGTCSVQVWTYDPKLLSTNNVVDPFSLFVSLRETADERIEMALDKLMERYL